MLLLTIEPVKMKKYYANREIIINTSLQKVAIILNWSKTRTNLKGAVAEHGRKREFRGTDGCIFV
jgi:L,D-peptidoglycan transpeptidase YkuD (ErfK/YbiS/YcfS/YnhG family)